MENKGVIFKSVDLLAYGEPTDADLKKINKYTLVQLQKEDVFVFKTLIADNGMDDRNYEPFDLKALRDLEKLYLGKTVIKDHSRQADKQVARIFDTELIVDNLSNNGNGEPFAKLITKQYMLNSEKNKELIEEIKAGIKKEVSTSCRPKAVYCSICGTDNRKSYCSHWQGREYDTKEGRKMCYMILSGVKEAFELSLVAVPSQPRASVTKNYSDEVVEEKQLEKVEGIEEKEKDVSKESELRLKARLDSYFIFTKNNGGKLNE